MEAGKRTDTIAAIATAVSSSGIGIVRVSGSQAISVVDQIFKSKNKGKRLKTRCLPYRALRRDSG